MGSITEMNIMVVWPLCWNRQRVAVAGLDIEESQNDLLQNQNEVK